MSLRRDYQIVWDLGPPKPKEPAMPAAPDEGADQPAYGRAMEQFHYELHMTRARHLLAGYDKAYGEYVEAQKDYDAFGGKPRQLSMSSESAKSAMAIDPRRYRLSLEVK